MTLTYCMLHITILVVLEFILLLYRKNYLAHSSTEWKLWSSFNPQLILNFYMYTLMNF